MERRNLLKFFPWVLSVFGLGALEGRQSKESVMLTNTGIIFRLLEEAEVFWLPENPKLGHSIVFIYESGNWEKNPPIIRSTRHGIHGKNSEDLLIDLNISFGLRFLGQSSGWQYFKPQA